MVQPEDQRANRTRARLLVAGWVLLAVGLLLGLAGPRLTRSDLPADIGMRMGDMDWLRVGWIIAGMIVGAVSLLCFAARWVLRTRETGVAHQPNVPQSK